MIRERARAQTAAGLAALTLGALLLRLIDLGAPGFWFDEAYTHLIARLPAPTAWQALLVDGVHPPLHYAIARAVVWLDGGEFALRVPSALAGALAVPVAFALGRRWFDGRTAWLTAALLAVSPFHLWHSRDARMYSLLALLSAGAMLAYARWLERPGHARAAALAGVSALAYLTHYFALMVPLVQFAHLTLRLRRHPRALRGWTAAQALAAVPLAAWIGALALRDAQVFGIGWIPAPSLADLPATLVSFTVGYDGPPSAWQWGGALACLALAACGAAAQGRQDGRALTLLWALLPALLTLGLSLRRPLYMDRFLIGSLVPLLLLVAAGAGRLPGRAAPAVAAALLVVFGAAGWGFSIAPGQTREQWREAAQLLERAGPDEAIIARTLQIVVPLSLYYRGGLPLQAMETNRTVSPLEELAAGRAGTWLVYWNAAADAHRVAGSPPFHPGDEVDPQAAAWLAGLGPPLIERFDLEGVTLLRFGGLP